MPSGILTDMAIFSLNHSFVSRSAGHKAVAGAAYQAREALMDRNGTVHDFTKRGGCLHAEIAAPKNAPAWVKDRQGLWNAVEAKEDKTTRPKDAQLAHSFRIALPHELTLEQNIWLLRDYLREQFTRHGFVADWAIHSPENGYDQRNIHAHVMVAMRPLENGLLGNKWRADKSLSNSVKCWRASWSKMTNRHLKRHGIDAKVDHRTLKEQGIDRVPGEHMGKEATWIERKGKLSMRGTLIRARVTRSKRSGGGTHGGQGEAGGSMVGSVAQAFKFHARDMNHKPVMASVVKAEPKQAVSSQPMTKSPSPAAGVPFERRVRNATVPAERRRPTL